jgi:hypothetical protein
MVIALYSAIRHFSIVVRCDYDDTGHGVAQLELARVNDKLAS